MAKARASLNPKSNGFCRRGATVYSLYKLSNLRVDRAFGVLFGCLAQTTKNAGKKSGHYLDLSVLVTSVIWAASTFLLWL